MTYLIGLKMTHISRKSIIKYFEKYIVEPNDCKYLDSKEKRAFYVYFRDRNEDQRYYLIKLKGNYIRAYCHRYVDSTGSGVNAFTSICIPTLVGHDLSDSLPKLQKTLMFKMHFKEYKEFCVQFINATPNLGWENED